MTAVLLMPRKPKRKAVSRYRVACTLQDLLDQKQMTQQELADETSLALSTIGIYARDQASRIDCQTAAVLCEYFNVDMCGLFPLVKEE